jgi:hypothetical protein
MFPRNQKSSIIYQDPKIIISDEIRNFGISQRQTRYSKNQFYVGLEVVLAMHLSFTQCSI